MRKSEEDNEGNVRRTSEEEKAGGEVADDDGRS